MAAPPSCFAWVESAVHALPTRSALLTTRTTAARVPAAIPIPFAPTKLFGKTLELLTSCCSSSFSSARLCLLQLVLEAAVLWFLSLCSCAASPLRMPSPSARYTHSFASDHYVRVVATSHPLFLGYYFWIGSEQQLLEHAEEASLCTLHGCQAVMKNHTQAG
jgi:hypothetical protein